MVGGCAHIHPRTLTCFLKHTSCSFYHSHSVNPKGPDLLEMTDLVHRCHGNFPQRRATLFPQVCRSGFSEMKKESSQFYNGEAGAALPSSAKQQRQPVTSVAAVLKRIRVHTEAQRILGNSCIPVVSLERLNFQSVSLLSLQPEVSLVQLPSKTQTELHNDVTLNHPQQNGFSENEGHILEIREDSPESEPAALSDLSQTETTSISWTEPYSPDSFPSEDPVQDAGFDCESNPDQSYILLDCGSDEWDPDGKSNSETFYLDPDQGQTIMIVLDPEPETDQTASLQLEAASESTCEVDVVEMEESEEQRADVCCSHEEAHSSIHQPEPGDGTEEVESEDFCAVCLNGGDLLCCDSCPKVYHSACHIPPLISIPLGDWVCTLCRSDQQPVEGYDCETIHNSEGIKPPYRLSNQDQRRCEKLTLLLYCHLLSAPFHEPVSRLARNYYQIIKRPIDLSVIRRKLDESKTVHYFSAEQFVDDVLLMFKNCATFNYPDSEVAQAGRKPGGVLLWQTEGDFS
ncbi:unnamed protein product [Pleuronectes platessa]|uniref:Uncharacterized protein n=1 Tax=Pleuronectes platessa TaxID=8262 RepID=A0A9N7TQ98_PLEPL|nr:unnamed protein product [Pleuronectes platessa]